MEDFDLVVVAKQALINEEIIPATVFIKDGKIIKVVSDVKENVHTKEVIQVPDHCVLMPGLVDSHVHVNEPGRTEWEGFYSATRAAAKGGVTTIADMPLNSIPPTTSVENLLVKMKAAEPSIHIDTRFIGGLVKENSDSLEIRAMLDAGVCGFKCFLIDSGVPEFTFVTEKELRSALKIMQGTNAFLMFHAELAVEEEPQKLIRPFNMDPKIYKTFLESRPKKMENKAIELVIALCKEFDVRCHIVHLSSAEAISMIKKAKDEGVKLTVETCYHYLYFDAEVIPPGQPRFKCCPPIRERDNREKLWEALQSGVIDMVVSDHSPCTAELKNKNEGSYLDSWGGISSIQFGLSIIYTEGKKRGVSLVDIHKWVTLNTSKLISLDDRKGRIKEGYDADLIIFDPTKSFVVHPQDIHYKNKISAYEGQELFGVIEKTILRGKVIYEDGTFVSPPQGQMILS